MLNKRQKAAIQQIFDRISFEHSELMEREIGDDTTGYYRDYFVSKAKLDLMHELKHIIQW